MGNEDAGESIEKSHYIRLNVFFAPKVIPVVFIGGAPLHPSFRFPFSYETVLFALKVQHNLAQGAL